MYASSSSSAPRGTHHHYRSSPTAGLPPVIVASIPPDVEAIHVQADAPNTWLLADDKQTNAIRRAMREHDFSGFLRFYDAIGLSGIAVGMGKDGMEVILLNTKTMKARRIVQSTGEAHRTYHAGAQALSATNFPDLYNEYTRRVDDRTGMPVPPVMSLQSDLCSAPRCSNPSVCTEPRSGKRNLRRRACHASRRFQI